MKTSSLRIAAVVVTIAPLLAFCPTVASGATVTVTVAPGGLLQFSPASVAIQEGDTVQWTWSDDGHSSTSGSPGLPSGLWDSGILNQGATFSHIFNTAGSFPYYCTPHGACCGMTGTVTVLPAAAAVNVTQHHNHDSRDGLYIDPAFTQAADGTLTRNTSFDGTISGNVYAQPLYIEGGPGGRSMVIAVTESNNVYALDAANGSIIWQRNVGTPVALADLPCGDIDPLGITGTPIVDLASRSLFLDAMTTPDGGTTKKHLIFSLNVDTGVINSGWPVDVVAVVSGFDSSVENERGALAIVNNIVYVPYGGHAGDCGTYHGWLVGVSINNPASVNAWATPAVGGGAWAVGGVSSDGATPFLATGNTFGATTWSGGEAIIRFQSGPVFSGLTSDYWAPTNWQSLDNSDLDIGGSGALIVDVPGATPSNLVVSLGKDGNAYLLNRSNLGGVSNPLAQLQVSSSPIIQAAATYRTNLGTYVVFRASSTTLAAFRINPTNPPTITSAWSVSQSGRGSPFVTSTDGTNNMTVWVVGSEGDQRSHGYDGDTGNVVYAGGGANELMTGTRRFNTGIAARGGIYIANDNKVYAFTVPTSTPTPTPTGTPTPSPTPASQAVNLSTRMFVQTGDDVGIGGFIITGSTPKHVVLRAIGPSLAQFGVPDVLADPVLELHGPGAFVTITNDNWRDTQEAQIQADGLAPTNDLESAIDATLAPGAYTGIVRGKNNTTGVGLIEVYDLSPSDVSTLGDISTRAFVSTGNNIVIAGFILGHNSGVDRIVARGIGPSLTAFGVSNALADPTLELRDSNGTLLIANNNWQDNAAQAAELMADGLAPTNPLESGIAMTLPPGLYTALLAGLNNGTGIGLVEVYDLGAP
jgi:plastocyanin/outer membrane protein assembly factor BamB